MLPATPAPAPAAGTVRPGRLFLYGRLWFIPIPRLLASTTATRRVIVVQEARVEPGVERMRNRVWAERGLLVDVVIVVGHFAERVIQLLGRPWRSARRAAHATERDLVIAQGGVVVALAAADRAPPEEDTSASGEEEYGADRDEEPNLV